MGKAKPPHLLLEVFHRKHGKNALLSQTDLTDEAQDGIDDNRADVHAEQWRRDAPYKLQERLGGPER
jgi:protocatechuate 3,4-dioxygenase beta subunit